jgi:predicted RNA-binding protein YlxR (DUF448 family)
VGTPIRRCVACRTAAPKQSLVRVALGDGTIVIDPEARRPGRGAYVCERPECLETALRRGGAALERALRQTGVGVDAEALRAAWRAATQSQTCRALADAGAGSRQQARPEPREEYE